jgi:hypothetical protein
VTARAEATFVATLLECAWHEAGHFTIARYFGCSVTPRLNFSRSERRVVIHGGTCQIALPPNGLDQDAKRMIGLAGIATTILARGWDPRDPDAIAAVPLSHADRAVVGAYCEADILECAELLLKQRRHLFASARQLLRDTRASIDECAP